MEVLNKSLSYLEMIKCMKKELNLTSEALSVKVGVSFLTLKRWEKEKSTPSRLALEKIQRLYKKILRSNHQKSIKMLKTRPKSNRFRDLRRGDPFYHQELSKNKTLLNRFRKYLNVSDKKINYAWYLNVNFDYIKLLEEHEGYCESDRYPKFHRYRPAMLGEDNEPSTKTREFLKQACKILSDINQKFNPVIKEFPIRKIISKHKLSEIEQVILFKLLKDVIRSEDDHNDSSTFILLRLGGIPKEQLLGNLVILGTKGKLQKNGLIESYESSFSMSERENININKSYRLTDEAINKIFKGLIDLEDTKESDRNKMLLKIKPRFRFDNVILPEVLKNEIKTALSQVQNHDLIFKKWRLEDRIKYGRGMIMLFSGPPGTGKTMMAESIAQYLNTELWTINYARLQSCWVGETEKNIQKVFREGSKSKSVLLIDEADSFVSSREGAVRNWEISQVNVLLQEVENYEGVVILTTNNKVALDRALERRLALKIEFPLPDATSREYIWRFHFPETVPLASDVDFQKISGEYELSGGEIKNITLSAVRRAVSRNNGENKCVVTLQDIKHAITQEVNNSFKEKSSHIGFKT